MKTVSDHRREIESTLRTAGYKLVEKQSDTSDPFAWSLIAQKDGYEIRIQERAKSLCNG